MQASSCSQIVGDQSLPVEGLAPGRLMLPKIIYDPRLTTSTMSVPPFFTWDLD